MIRRLECYIHTQTLMGGGQSEEKVKIDRLQGQPLRLVRACRRYLTPPHPSVLQDRFKEARNETNCYRRFVRMQPTMFCLESPVGAPRTRPAFLDIGAFLRKAVLGHRMISAVLSNDDKSVSGMEMRQNGKAHWFAGRQAFRCHFQARKTRQHTVFYSGEGPVDPNGRTFSKDNGTGYVVS